MQINTTFFPGVLLSTYRYIEKLRFAADKLWRSYLSSDIKNDSPKWREKKCAAADSVTDSQPPHQPVFPLRPG